MWNESLSNTFEFTPHYSSVNRTNSFSSFICVVEFYQEEEQEHAVSVLWSVCFHIKNISVVFSHIVALIY
uniref:Uncharacterized protein n=1 Tax=Anguilla anguilla TaxID=7936 RepID=A0A0E9XIV7_ANGAN